MELGHRDRMDDDRSSVSSFAVVADNHYGNDVGDESDNTNKCFNGNQSEGNNGSSVIGSPLIEIAKISYRDLLIGIFTTKDLKEKQPRRFYFEPLVFLDPKSIINESHGFFKQDFIRLTIQMWNPEIRSKVLERLQTLPDFDNLKISGEDICVMPYENVQLISNSGALSQSIKFMKQSTSYFRSKENLDFYLLCDLPSTATALTADFRKHPEFTLNNWQLVLECKGLAVKSWDDTPLFKRPTVTFNVSIHPYEIASMMDVLLPRLTDLEDKFEKMNKRGSSIPVFSVKKCTNPNAVKDQSYAFSATDFTTETEHGDFDLSTGIFSVKTHGVYQFQFSSNIIATLSQVATACNRQFELRVDGIVRASSYTNSGLTMSSTHTSGYANTANTVTFNSTVTQPVALTALLPLKAGEKVGVYPISGTIQEAEPAYVTRFSGILVSQSE